MVYLFAHAFIDSSAKYQKYLDKKGVPRQKEPEIRVMRGLGVWGQLDMARVGAEDVVIDEIFTNHVLCARPSARC